MKNIYLGFILTIFAGTSTMIGIILIFIKKKNLNNIILSSLSFASGVMLCTSITDLIPESLILFKSNLNKSISLLICILSIILGIIISMLIDYYLPDNKIKISKNKSLYKVGIISMLAIILHNIPEGIATFMATTNSTKLGISLTLAIAMHNIPEGISISVPIYYATGKRKKAIFYTLISAISEPIGAVLAFIFLKNIINDTILGILFSLIAGMMMQISICELLPEAKKYHNNKYVILFFVLGIIFMLLKFIFI